MDERRKKAFEAVMESSKQLLTLSTAIITITATIYRDVLKQAPGDAKTFIIFAWIIFLLSIVFGIWTILSLAGTLSSPKVEDSDLTPYRFNIILPAGLQILSFLIGLGFAVTFGIKSVS